MPVLRPEPINEDGQVLRHELTMAAEIAVGQARITGSATVGVRFNSSGRQLRVIRPKSFWARVTDMEQSGGAGNTGLARHTTPWQFAWQEVRDTAGGVLVDYTDGLVGRVMPFGGGGGPILSTQGHNLDPIVQAFMTGPNPTPGLFTLRIGTIVRLDLLDHPPLPSTLPRRGNSYKAVTRHICNCPNCIAHHCRMLVEHSGDVVAWSGTHNEFTAPANPIIPWFTGGSDRSACRWSEAVSVPAGSPDGSHAYQLDFTIGELAGGQFRANLEIYSSFSASRLTYKTIFAGTRPLDCRQDFVLDFDSAIGFFDPWPHGRPATITVSRVQPVYPPP